MMYIHDECTRSSYYRTIMYVVLGCIHEAHTSSTYDWRMYLLPMTLPTTGSQWYSSKLSSYYYYHLSPLLRPTVPCQRDSDRPVSQSKLVPPGDRYRVIFSRHHLSVCCLPVCLYIYLPVSISVYLSGFGRDRGCGCGCGCLGELGKDDGRLASWMNGWNVSVVTSMDGLLPGGSSSTSTNSK